MFFNKLFIFQTYSSFGIINGFFDNHLYKEYQDRSETGLLIDAIPSLTQVPHFDRPSRDDSFERVEHYENCHNGEGTYDQSLHFGNIDEPVSHHRTGGIEDIFTTFSSSGGGKQYSQFTDSRQLNQDRAHIHELDVFNHHSSLVSDTYNFNSHQDLWDPNQLHGYSPEFDLSMTELWQPEPIEAGKETLNIYDIPEAETTRNILDTSQVTKAFNSKSESSFPSSVIVSSYIEKKTKYDIFCKARVSHKKIEEHPDIFQDMTAFWGKMESKMGDTLTLFFPWNSEACKSLGLYTAKDIVFPLFINRASWIRSHFSSYPQLFNHHDLETTLNSAKEYFKAWMSKELDHFVEGVTKFCQIRRDGFSLYRNRSYMAKGLQSQVLYNLEFNHKNCNHLTGVPWNILNEWLSKNFVFWYQLRRESLPACKKLHNKAILKELSIDPDAHHEEFKIWKKVRIWILLVHFVII
ncbi:hypothetical protein DFH28DRAFT_900090 [Melampsora americana]|nr:hypothetical protein DFH28DRAFT_900090 [Melampsora americana]